MSERSCGVCGGSLEGQARCVKYCGAPCAWAAQVARERDRYYLRRGLQPPPRKHPVVVVPKPVTVVKPARAKAIACSSCVHGRANVQAAFGWECQAECAMACDRLGPARHWKGAHA